jgi:hypothetical protein
MVTGSCYVAVRRFKHAQRLRCSIMRSPIVRSSRNSVAGSSAQRRHWWLGWLDIRASLGAVLDHGAPAPFGTGRRVASGPMSASERIPGRVEV